MTRASKLTPQKIRTIQQARANGASLRDAAKLAGVGSSTVKRWEATGSAATAQQPAKERPKRREKAPPPVAAEVEALLEAPAISADDPEALQKARARWALVSELLEKLEPSVAAQSYPAAQWVTVARYGDELTRMIAELTPPKPQDPNESSDAREAERILLSRIEGMVVDAEAKQ